VILFFFRGHPRVASPPQNVIRYAAMKRTRIINGILAIAFLALTLALPVRGLTSSRIAAADVAARGTTVFNSEDVNSGAKSADYIMLALFGALTLVFAWRTIKPRSKRAA
jgi:hypothetical protein